MDAEPTVFIIDDDEAMRDGLSLMAKSVGLKAKSFSGAQEFLDSCDACEPGCLVLDVRMPGMSGLELQERLAERKIDLPVIFLTGHGDIQMSIGAMQAGAVDFIEKPPKGEVLLKTIRGAIAQDCKRRANASEKTQIAASLATLTAKERQVMQYLAQGTSDKQTASELGVSTRTVAYHRVSILNKLGIESTVELVRIAPDFDLQRKSRVKPRFFRTS